jgi:hypothetical protein
MLHYFAIALGFIVVACIATALPAAWMRHRHGAQQPSDTRDLARDVATRIGLLHGLILGLVFGQVMGQANALLSGIREEAASVERVYFRAGDYGAPQVQRAALAYLEAVIDDDWPRQQRERQLSDEGWRAWRTLSEQTLALAPTNRREQLLADAMQESVWKIEAHRQTRGFVTTVRLPAEFWFAAISGLVLIGAVFFIHSPTRKHLAVGAAYSIYAGIVLYMIYDLSHPFTGLVLVDPEAFLQALASIRSGV